MMILLLLKLELLISVDVVLSGDIETAILYVHVVCGKIPCWMWILQVFVD